MKPTTLLAVLLMSLSLASCKGADEAAPAPQASDETTHEETTEGEAPVDPGMTSTDSSAESMGVVLETGKLGPNNELIPAADGASFALGDTLIVSVTTHGPEGERAKVLWYGPGGGLVNEEDRAIEGSPPNVWFPFNTTGRETGRYSAEVWVAGEQKSNQYFQVD